MIQFKPRVPGESTRLAAMVLGSFADRIKNVILVDDDIDPFDLNMVLFSISTRTDADSAQVQIIRDLQANRQDPSTEKYLRVGGLIIDSTKPVGKPFPDIGKPPDDALGRIQLEDFVTRPNWEKSSVKKKLAAKNGLLRRPFFRRDLLEFLAARRLRQGI